MNYLDEEYKALCYTNIGYIAPDWQARLTEFKECTSHKSLVE